MPYCHVLFRNERGCIDATREGTYGFIFSADWSRAHYANLRKISRDEYIVGYKRQWFSIVRDSRLSDIKLDPDRWTSLRKNIKFKFNKVPSKCDRFRIWGSNGFCMQVTQKQRKGGGADYYIPTVDSTGTSLLDGSDSSSFKINIFESASMTSTDSSKWRQCALKDILPLDGLKVQFTYTNLCLNIEAARLMTFPLRVSESKTFQSWAIPGTKKLLFEAGHGNFISLDNLEEGATLVLRSNPPGRLEAFEIEQNPDDPFQIRIRAPNGLFLKARDGRCVVASGGDEDTDWSDFDPTVFTLHTISCTIPDQSTSEAIKGAAQRITGPVSSEGEPSHQRRSHSSREELSRSDSEEETSSNTTSINSSEEKPSCSIGSYVARTPTREFPPYCDVLFHNNWGCVDVTGEREDIFFGDDRRGGHYATLRKISYRDEFIIEHCRWWLGIHRDTRRGVDILGKDEGIVGKDHTFKFTQVPGKPGWVLIWGSNGFCLQVTKAGEEKYIPTMDSVGTSLLQGSDSCSFKMKIFESNSITRHETDTWKPSALGDIQPLDGLKVQLKSCKLNKFMWPETDSGTTISVKRSEVSESVTFKSWAILGTKKLFLQTQGRQFVSLQDMKKGAILTLRSGPPGKLEAFEIEQKLDDIFRIRVRAPNGSFLQAKDDKSVTADGSEFTDWSDSDPSVFTLHVFAPAVPNSETIRAMEGAHQRLTAPDS